MLRFKIRNLYTFSAIYFVPYTRLQSSRSILSPYMATIGIKSYSNECTTSGKKQKTKMHALEFDSKKKELCLVELHVPTKLPKNDVLLRVVYAGICGSDLQIFEGAIPTRENVILGHEFCGIVEKTGTDVVNVQPGDKVVVDPNSGCGKCKYCSAGNYHYCQYGGIRTAIGLFRNGGWSEFCLVPAKQVFKIPERIPFKHAVLTESLSCISHGWEKIQPLTIGKRILILGAGSAGSLYACLFHLHGHTNVTVCEPHKCRRQLLENLGMDFDIISPKELQKRKIDPCWGVDLVVDCSGNGSAIEEALKMLNPGGVLSIYGLTPPGTKIRVSPLMLFQKELTIQAVLINPYSINKALRFVEALGERYLNWEKLGIQEFGLTDYEEAIEILKTGNISKAVFRLVDT